MPSGRVVMERFESRILQGNAAGDPSVRTVPVYLPPAYDAEPERRFPVAYVLSGFTGRGRMLLNDNAWNAALDDRMNALIGRRECGEMILVMPDCLTRYGGSQYLNSGATGRYEDHIVSELVPYVDATWRTLPSRDHRGLIGKSSGGYGALVLGMRHPGVFGAVVSHSGDMAFDYCYRGDLPKACTHIQKAGGLRLWLETFEAKRQKSGDDMLTLNIVGMAACYSPEAAAAPLGFDLPVDLETGAFREEVWARWLAHDPLRLLDHHAEALRAMKLLYLDCGTRDEFSLQLGARLFCRRLTALGIPHQHEEFDDGHMSVQYRFDVSLPKLARALGAEG
jgi:enterochelin esterase family protein